MRVDTERLKKRIAASGMTKELFSTAIGIDYSTFNRKMNCDGLAFSVGQMHKMVDILGLSHEEANKIFFAQ